MKEYKKKIDDAVEKAGDNFKKMKEQQQYDNPPAKKLKKAVESGKNEAKNEKDREDGWKDLDREKEILVNITVYSKFAPEAQLKRVDGISKSLL